MAGTQDSGLRRTNCEGAGKAACVLSGKWLASINLRVTVTEGTEMHQTSYPCSVNTGAPAPRGSEPRGG